MGQFKLFEMAQSFPHLVLAFFEKYEVRVEKIYLKNREKRMGHLTHTFFAIASMANRIKPSSEPFPFNIKQLTEQREKI